MNQRTWVSILLLIFLVIAVSSDLAFSAAKSDLENKVIIYSTHPENMLAVIADGFTEKTGVKVDFINLKGELADRVRAEKKNPQADIMYGGPSSLYMAAAAFLEYAGSAEVQVILANRFSRMPTLERVLDQCPEWMQTPVKMMPVNWENISLHELEWLNLWDTQIRDSSRDI